MIGLEDNVRDDKTRRFLNEILNEIQGKLRYGDYKLMVKTMNNITEFMKFVRNENQNESDREENNALMKNDGKFEIGIRIVATLVSPTISVGE